jgi:hypothetical protein
VPVQGEVGEEEVELFVLDFVVDVEVEVVVVFEVVFGGVVLPARLTLTFRWG